MTKIIKISELETMLRNYINEYYSPDVSFEEKGDLFFTIVDLYGMAKDVSEDKSLMTQASNLIVMG